jgi:GDP/UDP-N,N'-diacetylbacillosamine 2-epimerase (hydrolysing)
MSIRKVCVITGSRSEYGLFYPVLKKILNSGSLELQLITSSAHHSVDYGSTYQQIEDDGFTIDEKIESLSFLDDKLSVVKSAAKTCSLLSESLARLNPDIVLLLGDRYETHAAAIAALLMNIPIAHIHGGEKTEGAVDEQIRHSITKMSYLHFCSTEDYRQRIIQMGEDPLRVFQTGAPGVDNILNLTLLSKKDLEKELNWQFTGVCALFTYHPVTLEVSDLEAEIKNIFSVLKSLDINIIFTYANADSGGKLINTMLEEFCKTDPDKYIVSKSLGQLKYLSAMNYVDLLIGNSSSGIIEAASYKKPVVNIGDRQKGRLRGLNVIDCKVNTLYESILLALSFEFKSRISDIDNIYGEGKASDLIVEKLISEPISVIKSFKDI